MRAATIKGPALAAAVVVAANLLALAGVARNRAGGPRWSIELTEKELPLAPRGLDNTRIALRLEWENTVPRWDRERRAADWFDRAKLEGLGFDCRVEPGDPGAERHYNRQLPREAWVVLEYGGDPGASGSRLRAADAGPDEVQLRSRYGDPARFLVLPGRVRMVYEKKEGRLRGAILGLLVDQIQVPREHRSVFEGWRAGSRYAVTLGFGARGEPWVTGARRLP